MSLGIQVEPLEALEFFHKGEELGIWENDLIRNEKKRDLYLPQLVKEFLLRFGRFNVNRGMSQIWMPDKIDRDTAKVDGEMRDIWILGKFRNNLVAIPVDECDQENPLLLLDNLPEENGEEVTLVFHKSDLSLKEFLIVMLIESPSVYDNAEVYDSEDGLQEFLNKLDNDSRQKLEKQIKEGSRPGRFLAWDEKQRYFIALVLLEDRVVLLKFKPCLAVSELESLFVNEFYENAEHCNYQHALGFLLTLIDYWSKREGTETILAEKYRLAGRCCWALKRWMDAEKYYKQAEQFYKKILLAVIDRNVAFYEGMGNFYLAREDIFKSQSAFLEADRLCEFAGKNGPRNKGERIMRQGIVMAEAKCYDEAIELYNKALVEYEKDPKDCKYNIARCQQLRGDAKKKLKEKNKIKEK